MPEGSKYNLIIADTAEELVALTQKAIDEGWQPAGPLVAGETCLLREMIYIPVSPMQAAENQRKEMAIQLAKDFQERFSRLDPRAKDLLDINDISVFNEDGQLFTRIGDKISTGISPMEILAALKASRHCPLDLDEEWFLSEIGGLV